MQPPLPSPTPTWHNDTYAAISPSRPELRAAEKTIVITGAGSGIGRETAIAYASAGAARLVLLGRTKTTLEETASLLPGHASKEAFPVDVTQEDALRRVAKAIGTWDVLILAAGYVSEPSPMASASTDAWWQSFETNVKALFLAIKVFTPTKNVSHATILALTSGAAPLPSSMLPGQSAYAASKLAQTKLIEFLASEQPDIFAATVHPGLVETAIFKKSGGKAEAVPMDKVQLPAHFLLWMSSPEATFLNGRSVWANWDVIELKEQAEQIKSGVQMTAGMNGWPYTSS
ncbi:putative NADP(+)-dependent dehydrogenase [Hypoxylon fuscum]|nr:putative NADP(+)-dependent dehydrogenase [Hypoxylon fuscum]